MQPDVFPPITQTPEPVAPVEPPHRSRKPQIIIGVLLLIIAGLVAYILLKPSAQPTKQASITKTTSSKPVATAKVEGVQLDEKKNYGNKYADGLLPVGDGKYSSSSASVGTVYTCAGYTQNLKSDSGGAGSRGPWFTNNNTQYDLNKKARVSGSVSWQSSFSNTVNGSMRTIVTNDLPSHITGVYPIARSDPAYQYDRNPNTISAQSLTYSLPLNPTYGSPQCMGGQSGIMLTGVALFNGFDAGGRDAGAWEVQDNCSGHPEKQGEYHYHTLSSCIKDTSVHTIIGYALDGYPITGPQVGTNNILTTADLDECHGLTSSVIVNGKSVTTYHYVMTQDFPYSVSCFRSTPTQPPGMPAQGSQQGGNLPPRQ